MKRNKSTLINEFREIMHPPLVFFGECNGTQTTLNSLIAIKHHELKFNGAQRFANKRFNNMAPCHAQLQHQHLIAFLPLHARSFGFYFYFYFYCYCCLLLLFLFSFSIEFYFLISCASPVEHQLPLRFLDQYS